MFPPEIRIIFRLGQIFGFLPFRMLHGVLVFDWLSLQIVYFFVVFCFCLASFAYVAYAFVITTLGYGMAEALLLTPWVAGFGTNILAMISALMNKDEIVTYVNLASMYHEKNQHDSRYRLTKRMWGFHLFWLVKTCGVPQACCLVWAFIQPVSLRSLYTSVLCYSDDLCPLYINVPSIVLEALIIFYTYFLTVVLDLLPLANAYAIHNWMKISSDHMLEHGGEVDHCSHNCFGRLFRVTSSIKYRVQDEGLPAAQFKTEEQRDAEKIGAIRNIMSGHLEIQSVLQRFNPAFAPFIFVCFSQVFSMCIIVFFGFLQAMKTGNVFHICIFLGNGLQYIVRGSLILSVFGRVKKEAERLKSIIMLDIGLFGRLGKRDLTILQEVELFINTLDDTCIKCGSYLNFTPGFLFSFYGIVATYIAILYQSFA